ncbi:acyclic terpene utilization AtuA family protein [Nonomuraea sp. NPDC047897]|uniref:acyclic terpene utilization AtuA family protein n=1 Tax=Nonomuraea sp. NPDC047897 TaxID=3364346 RepID=UPI003721F48E
MLRIGTSGSAGSADVVICGWRDGRRPRLRTGVKLVFQAGGTLPDLPGLRVGRRPARGAEELARALCEGFDVVVAEAGDPAAPVVAAGMWHYGWTAGDVGPLAGATVAGLVLAGLRAPCALEVRADGGATLDCGSTPGHEVTVADVLAGLAARFRSGRYRTPVVTVPLASVRLTQETCSRVRVAPCAGEPVYLAQSGRVQSV